VDDDRVTVTDLLHARKACDPDAAVRLAAQPAWPFQYAIDPTNAAVQVELDGAPGGVPRPRRPARLPPRTRPHARL
jgi:hypothetical protein